MSFQKRLEYYWKNSSWNELSRYNYKTRKDKITSLENELKEDKELTETDKRFITDKVIKPIKEYMEV